jgi:pantoate--beta-alanine ligase
MKILTTISDMQMLSRNAHASGQRVGFVPTMGALHSGHLSLMHRARKHADVVVASIFVNPTQFAPNEDFDAYPRNLDHDRMLLEGAGVDALFAPTASEMYPPGFCTDVAVGGITQKLEGRTRPTHFAGVTLVVTKLLLAAQPDVAVFGRKDAQQALVIRRMVRDLNFGIEIDVAPTLRESDGLALSSRNAYLTPEMRKAALALSRGLRRSHDAWLDGETSARNVVSLIDEELHRETLLRIDYVEVVSQDTLEPVEIIKPDTLVAAAVFAGDVRLIDNWWITADGTGEI